MASKEFSPPALDEEELQLLYTWVDDIPLSRPKKNITRDFSDGVLMAEIARHFFPKLVQIHNYSSASSNTQKMYNWNTLNRMFLLCNAVTLYVDKVLRKLDFPLTREEIDAIVKCKMGAIEYILKNFQVRITQLQQQKLQENKMKMEEAEFEASGEVVLPNSPPPQMPTHYHQQQHGKANSKPSTAATTYHAAPQVQMQQPTMNNEVVAEKDAKIKELTETVSVCWKFC